MFMYYAQKRYMKRYVAARNLVVGMRVGVRSRPTSKSYLIQRYQWPVHQSI